MTKSITENIPEQKKEKNRKNYEDEFIKTLSLVDKEEYYINKLKTYLGEARLELPKKDKIQKSFECMVLAKLYINYFIKTSNIHYNFIATTYIKTIELLNQLLEYDIIEDNLDGNFILYYIKYLNEFTKELKKLVEKYIFYGF
jgi:hypothetical protein